MDLIILTVLSLDIAVILIHTLALTLLLKIKKYNVKGCQRLLLIALSVIELSYAVVNIGKELSLYKKMEGVAEVLSVFSLMYIFLVYVFIMFLITIDRFLEIYLNIKYRILWSPKKTMFILLFGVILSFFALIPSYVNGQPKTYSFTITYMFPVTEAIFVIVASSIYFYITKQVLRHRKKTLRLRKQLQANNRISHQRETHNRFKLFVPTLIIATFILFMVGSNILSLCGHLQQLNTEAIAFILIPIGYIVDPIIYIFNLKPVRILFKSMICK